MRNAGIPCSVAVTTRTTRPTAVLFETDAHSASGTEMTTAKKTPTTIRSKVVGSSRLYKLQDRDPIDERLSEVTSREVEDKCEILHEERLV